MSLSNITSAKPVHQAIEEFDRVGRGQFLRKYGFGSSRIYWLKRDGHEYDSKAIVGAAHGYARPELGPLRPHDFNGGRTGAVWKLQQLGFMVETSGQTLATTELTSKQLTPEEIYTRHYLRSLFNISDATLNTGVFQPKGTSSIWLFVTQEKTADRTPYRDHLEGDTLYWQGQTFGRTDNKIIDHYAHGMELLVFFREKIYQHPKAGFRYLGPFTYVSHTEGKPSSIVLQRVSSFIESIPAAAADDDIFDPTTVKDARRRTVRKIAQRRGETAFRNSLLQAYAGKCAITNCSILDVLEAAHIYPYRGPETNSVTNGLLLRADIHTLFDCGLIVIDPDSLAVLVDRQLRGSEYGHLHGREISAPSRSSDSPSSYALRMHLEDARLRTLP